VQTLFITGTDTGIGKTFASAQIACDLIKQGKKVAYYKPIQTGCTEKDLTGNWLAPDVEFVKERCPQAITKCSYALELPATPSLAAQKENIEIDFGKIKKDLAYLQAQADFVLVEGAGGLFVPVTQNKTIADLIKYLELPTLLVSANKLGTINQTCLSINYAKSKEINLIGFTFSGLTDEFTLPEVAESNTGFIENFGGLKYLDLTLSASTLSG
jgi:dethiobiotin synthetase